LGEIGGSLEGVRETGFEVHLVLELALVLVIDANVGGGIGGGGGYVVGDSVRPFLSLLSSRCCLRLIS
jgi:hypothetical protein